VSVRTLNSAPLAALFLTLTPIVFVRSGSPAGLPVLMAKEIDCGWDDRRNIVIHALQSGKLKLNMEDSDRVRLGERLHEIFKTRAEQVVFISADPQLSFQEVTEVIDIATKHVANVALLTPTLKLDPSHCLTITPWPWQTPKQ
jgi:biopolymer transport protein ExbD